MPNADTPIPLRRRAGAVGLSVVLFAAGAIIDTCGVVNVPGARTFDEAGSPQATPLGIVVWLVLIGCWSTVFLRRRFPLVPLIAGAVPLLVGSSYPLLLIGAVVAARRRPAHARGIWVVVGASLVAFVVRELTTGWGGALAFFFLGSADPTSEPIAAVIATPLLAAAAFATALGIWLYLRTRAQRDANRDRADREQLRADALGAQMAQQAERDRIARDIHDALSHRLSAISLQAGAFEASAAGDTGIADRARSLREQAHASLEDLRGLLGQLRMERSDTAPVRTSMKAVGRLVQDLRAGGTPIDAYIVIDDADQAGAALDTAVYRIVQESLTNAIKHAGGASVSVFVEASPATGARIRVTNPVGTGGQPPPGSGRGIDGIRQRADALDGTAWVGASDDLFIVDVTLPWPAGA